MFCIGHSLATLTTTVTQSAKRLNGTGSPYCSALNSYRLVGAASAPAPGVPCSAHLRQAFHS